jgi:hypothetical protein
MALVKIEVVRCLVGRQASSFVATNKEVTRFLPVRSPELEKRPGFPALWEGG